MTQDNQQRIVRAPAAEPPRLLTNDETAAILRVHPKSLVRARVYGGRLSRLPHCKVGRGVRYRMEDVERFLSVNTAQTAAQQRAG